MLTVLAGGVGAARFLAGLVHAAPPESITAIVNTGDDINMYGLHISPDIDIVTYTLAGIVHPEQGWGVAGDSFECLSVLRKLGHQIWFNLGDRDLGVHIHRTLRLSQGRTLALVTDEIRKALGVRCAILPMSNDPVRTYINNGHEVVAFQDYFVRRKAMDPVKEIVFSGVDQARPAPGVLEAIAEASGVIVAPSNPFVSIGTILAIPGVREALKQTGAPVAAISPIVGGATLKGPADRMMAGLGHEVSALGVARLYRDFVDVMVIDIQDGGLRGDIEKLGLKVVVTDTIMSGMDKKINLARTILNCLELSS